ncbi:HAMP domain-containing histidine kinase, partial [Coleofasciculus sp. FACHB-712]|uniref:sensor histidine kinase n=1 Tax=Coleofasciculus sp. FACHB-712 TaxID=2692789 RepID=UPI001686397F
RQIVLSLRNFSRLDEAERKPVDIHTGIDSTLLILQHRLKAKSDHAEIDVVKEYGDLPPIECYAGQMNQVFMNVIGNAIDALEQRDELRSQEGIKNLPSQITIRTFLMQDNPAGVPHVVIQIRDNGPGMSPGVQCQVFDPFFTTKPVGKGTGLGLSISYQIVVEKHGGFFKCMSQPGQGTEFWIEIPLKSQLAQSGYSNPI